MEWNFLNLHEEKENSPRGSTVHCLRKLLKAGGVASVVKVTVLCTSERVLLPPVTW
jgi:hypothetical protein